MWLTLLLELHMRRPILNATVASLIALTVLACTDTRPTGLADGPLKAAAPPPGGDVMMPPPKISLRPGPEDLIDIVAGDDHTCVRKGNKSVYCWGASYFGQAGTTPTALGCFGTSICVNRPRLLTVWGGDGTRVPFTANQIDAGADHTCAINLNRDVNCWGEGTY